MIRKPRFAVPSRPFLAVWVCMMLVLTTGCEALPDLMNNRPTAQVTNVRLTGLTMDQAELAFDVEVENPHAVPIPMVNLAYSLASDGRTFIDDAVDLSGEVPAQGSRRVTLPARVSFAELLAVARSIRPGQVAPYEARLELSVDTPVLGRVRLPMRRSGEVPVPAPPQVTMARAQWTELSPTRVSGQMDLEITNTNAFQLALQEFDYALQLGGTRVANSTVEKAVTFSPGEAARLTVPVSFSPLQAGVALLTMLRDDSGSYEIGGAMTFDSPYGQIILPYDAKGQTRFE